MKIPLKSVLREMRRRGISFANPYKGASKFNQQLEAVERYLQSDKGKVDETIEELADYIDKAIKLHAKYKARIEGKAKLIKNPEMKQIMNENVAKLLGEMFRTIGTIRIKADRINM